MSTMLLSKARGSWGYEVPGEGKFKDQYEIVNGINTIPDDHMKIIEEDLGYKAKIKKGIFKVMNAGDIKKAEKAEEKKAKQDAKEKDLKAECDQKIKEMSEECAAKLKAQKTNYEAQLQSAIETKAIAEKKNKDLELEVVNLKKEMDKQKSSFESELANTVKKLESENSKLQAKIQEQQKKLKS